MTWKTWLTLGIIYIATWLLAFKLSEVIGKIGGLQYFISVVLLTWIPGSVGLLAAKLEGFKIPIFSGSGRVFLCSFLFAWIIGICFNLRSFNGCLWLLEHFVFLPVIGLFLFWINGLSESIFWFGYLYKKLEHLHPFKAAFIIGVTWGLWLVPLVLFNGYHYDRHRLEGTAVILLFTVILSPLLLYLRYRSRSVSAPVVFFATLMTSRSFCEVAHRSNINDLIEGITGLHGMIVLFCCSAIACMFLFFKPSRELQN